MRVKRNLTAWADRGVMLLNAVSGLGSLIPLIPSDGYFVLIDMLKLPNLRQRAFTA